MLWSLFSSLLKSIPYYRYIVGGLLVLLAVVVYFEILGRNQPKKVPKGTPIKPISLKRILKLVLMGFVISFITVIDDMLAYSTLFLNSAVPVYYAVSGILFATVLQLITIVYFSKKLYNFKYKKLITIIGLLIIAGLVMGGVL